MNYPMHYPPKETKCIVNLWGNDGFKATIEVEAKTFGEAQELALQKFAPLKIEGLKVVSIFVD